MILGPYEKITFLGLDPLVVHKATINLWYLKLSYHEFTLATDYNSATNIKIYHWPEYTANDHKLPTTVSEIKCTGTFFLWHVLVHFWSALCQKKTSLWQNWRPPSMSWELASFNSPFQEEIRCYQPMRFFHRYSNWTLGRALVKRSSS